MKDRTLIVKKGRAVGMSTLALSAFSNVTVIKYKTRKSPLWKLLEHVIPGYNNRKTFLPVGRTIYMPPKVKICPENRFIHENVHLRQQGYSLRKALVWWYNYVSSKKFRFEQELEAYKTQVKWFNDTHKSTIEQKYQYRLSLAYLLASPMYGQIITKDEAFKKLGEKTH